MESCVKYNWREPILDKNQDHTLSYYPHHNVLTHLGCVMLRVGIGMAVITVDIKKENKKKIAVMFFVFALVFLFKYIKTMNVPLWKSYIRPVLAYTLSGILVLLDKKELAGMLFLTDTLSSIQARHTASIMHSC